MAHALTLQQAEHLPTWPTRPCNDMIITLPDSAHLVRDPGSSQWTLVSAAGAIKLNDTVAGILRMATRPITLPMLIDQVLHVHQGALMAIDVLAFVEAALAQEWLEYRP